MAYEVKLGYAPVPNEDFAKDVQASVDSRRDSFEPPAWDRRVGLLPDSSVLIAAEREKRTVGQLLTSLSAEYSETEFLPPRLTPT